MSQYVFWKKLDNEVKYQAVKSIHYVIVICVVSNEDYDMNLINLMNMALVEGLLLNSK